METEVSSKSNSSRPMVNRINSVIPEASERDELTVNEAVHQTIEFPIEPSTAKKEKVASKYLTDYASVQINGQFLHFSIGRMSIILTVL